MGVLQARFSWSWLAAVSVRSCPTEHACSSLQPSSSSAVLWGCVFNMGSREPVGGQKVEGGTITALKKCVSAQNPVVDM